MTTMLREEQLATLFDQLFRRQMDSRLKASIASGTRRVREVRSDLSRIAVLGDQRLAAAWTYASASQASVDMAGLVEATIT
jgi:hypothetical protein